MTPLLFAALVAILSVQPNLHIAIGDTHTVSSSRSVGASTVVTSTTYTGFTVCDAGVVVKIAHPGDEKVLTHEALHGADCVDDGELNGSLLPHPPTEADAAHEWVGWAFQNPDEAIAIMERTR